MGRMREFYQCDIDVINVDNLPLSFDAEVAAVAYKALEALDIGKVQLRISNRKILFGFLEANQITNPDQVTYITRLLDKVEKIGEENAIKEIEEYAAKEKEYSSQFNIIESFKGFLTLTKFANSAELKAAADELKTIFKNLNDNQTFQEGIDELAFILDNLSHLPAHAVIADLTIVRGLDYYTGTVYETQLLDVPEFTGSVCSGGRYDDLASQYINKKLPGVGISIGFSRLFDVIRQSRPDLLNIGPKSPTDILLYTEDTALTTELTQAAQTLRQRGFNVDQYHTVKKWDKHFKYAEKKKIPYIGYIKESGTFDVKNMATGEQSASTPESWVKE